ncbi:MAG: phosphoglycerate mutase [Hydrogenophaga sp.]|uniref:phosphoglycerate mutase n=1 Tax=Hydrogenophaga sp. TaxID=1904254 RepID=UPI001D1D91B7|nr:phosphoglycerate mutase [Hydrogenophaga sp.]MBX3610086.1 phosphoglycerate mutase [Hydrogenophaga sp.]
MPALPLNLDSDHHWVVPFASFGQGGQRPDIPPLPNLQRLLAILREAHCIETESTAFDAPHELALAWAQGVPASTTGWPGAALASAQPGTPQAWVHPVHLQVGMDQVQLQPGEGLALSEAHARALFDALQPLCAEDGVELRFDSPTRWHAQGTRLGRLRCASLDRVAGRSVAAWLPQGDEARWLQRLMSEAQMLFYTHPVNDEREASRQLAINGIWVDAAGAVPTTTSGRPAPHCVDSLRASALQGDVAAWQNAWKALDATLMRDLLARHNSGQALTLTLCGEQAALTLTASRPGPWQRLGAALGMVRATTPTQLLNTL